MRDSFLYLNVDALVDNVQTPRFEQISVPACHNQVTNCHQGSPPVSHHKVCTPCCQRMKGKRGPFMSARSFNFSSCEEVCSIWARVWNSTCPSSGQRKCLGKTACKSKRGQKSWSDKAETKKRQTPHDVLRMRNPCVSNCSSSKRGVRLKKKKSELARLTFCF